MTNNQSEDIAAIATGLTVAKELHEDLTVNWDAFCDADPLPHPREYFPDSLDAAGYAELVPVDDDALDDPFAAERGIEPGGMMWRLRPIGLALRAHLNKTDGEKG